MKRYRLIKKLPFEESPEVGYISKPHWNGGGSLHYWNHNWFNPKDYPEYWEEMIEKDYEVLSLEYGGHIYYKSTTPDPTYSGHFKYINNVGGWISMMSVIRPINVLDITVKIHSIKRLSDGEVFTVGDEVSFKYYMITVSSKITKFKLEDNEISYKTGYGRRTQFKTIKHTKKPIFTTEDGVDILEGKRLYVLDTENDEIFSMACAPDANEDFKRYKYFSTVKSAKQYITNNKKLFSLKDLKKHYHDANPNVGKLNHATQRFFKHLEDVADRLF